MVKRTFHSVALTVNAEWLTNRSSGPDPYRAANPPIASWSQPLPESLVKAQGGPQALTQPSLKQTG